MKAIITILFSVVLTFSVKAQFVQVDQRAGYAEAVYVDLATRSTTSVDHTAWDIAFNVGGFSSGILVNEGLASSQSVPLQEVELYVSTATDFATADTTEIVSRVYNGEADWNEGAFNVPAAVGDPFDLGWGNYSPATQTVLGSRVFFLVTRDGNYHKLFIQSLASGVYTFVHGPLDGSSSDTVSIAKDQFIGKTLAYFSLEEGILDLEPANWDLLFTRYVTPLDDGEGNILDYTVTGVLHNQDVRVARLTGVDPVTVAPPTDDAAYSDTLTTIGFDWKSFDLTTFQWAIPEDRVYFVETPDSLYRIQFIDFEGSSTGVSTLQINGESPTAIGELPTAINRSRLFPNPVSFAATLEVETSYAATNLDLEVVDPAGRKLYAATVRDLNVGLNQINIPLNDLPAGHYFVRLSGSIGVLTHHLIKQ